jgi:hypothetical protein
MYFSLTWCAGNQKKQRAAEDISADIAAVEDAVMLYSDEEERIGTA